MDKKKLLKYAVDYLSKYDSSKKNLLDVLKRKIFRLNLSNIEKSKLLNVLNEVAFNLEKNNFINDTRYCSSKILSLSKSGKSKKFIYNYLIKKGINKLEINNNLKIFLDNNYDWEFQSAKIFAKKKKLLETKDGYEKKLAKMARAGFSYDICKKILS